MNKNEVLKEIKKLNKTLSFKYKYTSITKEEIHALYIEYLKLSMLISTNSPQYKSDLKDYKRGNCYCYALGLKFPYKYYYLYNLLSDDPFVHSVGFISQSNNAFTKNEIMDNLYKDLHILNINVSSSSIEDKNENGYKVAIYFDNKYKNFNNFHIARQNSNGLWSEKVGYTSEILEFEHPNDSLYVKEANYHHYKTLRLTKPLIKN